MKPYYPKQLVDFHVHLFPDQLFDAIWRFFSKNYSWEVIYKYYHQQAIDYLRQRTVTHIIYSNYAHKKGIAKPLNDWNLDLLDQNRDLYCFAAFHPDDENSIQMAEKVLDHPQVIGFKMQFLVQGFYPTDDRMFPLYELVMKRNKRLLFHIGDGPAGNPYVGFKNFLPLINRYPQLPVNIAHMGGYEFEPFFDLLADHKNLMMDTTFCFFPSMDMKFNLHSDYLENNRDRLLYGSDFPNLTLPREEEIDTLLSLNLSKEFYQNVFYRNGINLLDEHCR